MTGRGLRVLVVTNMYPPHSYGGYEQSCRDVVTRWRARGHQVLVLTGTVRVPGAGDGTEEDPALVRRQLRLYWDQHRIVDPPVARRPAIELANARSFADAVRQFRPDVVSAWAMGALSLSLLTRAGRAGLPVVPVVCDEWPVYGPEVDAWLRPLHRRPALRRAAAMVSGLPTALPDLDALGPSCFISDWLLGECRRRSPWRFDDATVVYSGYQADEFPARAADPPWRWRLLYAGRIDPRKGIDTAVRALARCPAGATLEIDGRGDDAHRDELAALAERLGVGDRVSFRCSPRAELGARMADADAVVFPSTWEEPFGLVPVEAMSCGTPVVGTPVGGTKEFLADGWNALTFTPGDDAALAAALHRLAGDDALRARLRRGGLATAAELGVDRLADVLEEWHVYAAGRPSVPRPADRPRVGRPASLSSERPA